MADNRDRWGEYGGKPGRIHTAADGHEELTAAEQRAVLATYGIRTPEIAEVVDSDIAVNGGVDAATGEKWEDAGHRTRVLRMREARARVSGRGVEDVG